MKILPALLILLGCAKVQAQTLEWAKRLGGSSYDGGSSLAIDASGNVYITGYFQGTADFDPGPGSSDLTSAGGYDVFISKLDASGNFVWAKSMGSANFDNALSIAVDASGNVYTTGYFRSTVDFDPGPGTFDLISEGSDDVFISKLDDSGNFVWAKSMGSGNEDGGSSIEADASGNIYLTGYFRGITDFDPGPGTFNLTSAGGYDIFISMLTDSGDLVWAKNMGGNGSDLGYSIAVDASGNVYTTGYFQETADFDPGAGTLDLTAVGDDDIFISKLDDSGNLVWAKSMGSVDSDLGQSIAVDASGNVYTTGTFLGTLDADPGAETFNLISAGSYDIFISKLDDSGNFVWGKSMGGAGIDDSQTIVLDPSGNVYTTGSFTGVADFDPGPGIFNLTSVLGYAEIFISRLEASGNFVWAKSMGGSNGAKGYSVVVDNSGNVYTAGNFYETVDFDPDAGTLHLTSAGFDDVFISKLSQPVDLGIEDPNVKLARIYPNPAEDLLTIEIELTAENAKAELYDLNGTLLHTSTCFAGSDLHTIDVSGYAPAVYMLTITVGEKTFTHKIVKQP